MKQIQTLLFALLFTAFACSKQSPDSRNGNTIINPPTLISRDIDFTFNLNPSCYESYEPGSLYFYPEKQISLSALGNNMINGTETNMRGLIWQSYLYTIDFYTKVRGSVILYGTENKIHFECPGFSLLSLPVNGSYNFSGACIVTSGTGIFKNALTSSLSPLTITGFANTGNNIGQFRIRGTIHY